MIKEFFDGLSFSGEEKLSLNEYSPLNLAYIGDAVFEMCVRTMVIKNGNIPVNKLHKSSMGYVNAKAQADMFEKIKDKLAEDEFSIMKRGRNAKSFTAPKNADIADYRHATGLEALFGYLYLKGDIERLIEIFNMCINKEN